MKQFFLRHWAVISIFVVWVIFSSPFLFKGLIPFPSDQLVTFFPPWSASYTGPVKNAAMPDVITQIYPWKKLTIESWKNRQIPLWNPYSFSGTVQAANYQSAVFSPFNLLFFVLPERLGWSWLVLLQSLLAGLFMYLYLSRYVSRPARLLGCLAFMFCGFIVVWMTYGTLGYAALFLPLILWGIDEYFNLARWKTGILISAGLAISFLSGHFQISLYVLLMAEVYLIYKTIATRKINYLFIVSGFMGAGLLLALPQLWLTFDQFRQTVRSISFGKGEVIPWSYLITFIAPDFFGSPVTRNDWFGHYAEWAGFIGVTPLLLAVLSLTLWKKREVKFFWIATAVSAFLAYPSPFVEFLYMAKIPVLATSAASRVIILTSFSLAVLSAWGLDWYLKLEKRSQTIWRLASASAILLLVVWFGVLFGSWLPTDKLTVAKRNLLLPTIIAISGCGLLVIGNMRRKFLTLVVCFLLLLTAFDLLRFAAKWMPFTNSLGVYPPTPLSKFLAENIGQSRVYGNIGGEFTTYFKFPFIEGYDTMYQARFGELVSAASSGKSGALERSVVRVDKEGQYAEKLLQMLGVRYLLHRVSDGRSDWAYPYWRHPHYRQAYSDANYEVWENTLALPRAYLVDDYIVLGSDESILAKIYSLGFDPRREVVLENQPVWKANNLSQTASGLIYSSVSWEKNEDNEIVLSVITDEAKLLVLSDVYDSGWMATVDGRKTEIIRANYVFRAVPVPVGKHKVRFSYRPRGIQLGLPITGLTLLVLAGGLIIGKIYAHRSI